MAQDPAPVPPAGGGGGGGDAGGGAAGAGGSVFRGIQVVPSVTFRETFTDNVDLEEDGNKDPALITQIVPRIDFSLANSRLTWGFGGELNLSYTALNDTGYDTSGDLATAATVELLNDLFYVDAAASIGQELLDSEQGSSGAEGNENNLETVQNYLVSPYFNNRWGSFAASELRYSFGYGNFGGDEASDTFDHQLGVALDAGPQFTNFLWGVDAVAARQLRDDDDDIERNSAEVNTEVIVNNDFSLLGAVGYNTFDDGDDGNEVNEPLWEAGFRYAPTRRTELLASYGERNGVLAPQGRLSHALSPRTRIVAEYSEALGTSQDQFFNNLRAVTLDEEGRLVSRDTRVAFDASASDLSIDDRTAESRRASLTIASTQGRNTIGLQAFYEDENTLSEDDDDDTDNVDEEAFGLDLTWTRLLLPNWTGGLSAQFSRSEFREDDNQKNNEYTVGATLSYTIIEGAALVANYTFRLQDSTDPEDEFTENAASLGLTLRF